jgi:hypothetical protein
MIVVWSRYCSNTTSADQLKCDASTPWPCPAQFYVATAAAAYRASTILKCKTDDDTYTY